MKTLQLLSANLYRANDLDTKVNKYCVVLSARNSKRIKVFWEEVYSTKGRALNRARIMIGQGYRAGGSSMAVEYASAHVSVDAFDVRIVDLSDFYVYSPS